MPGAVRLPQPRVPPRPRVRIRISGGLVRGALSVLIAAALWEIAGRTFLNNPLFFAPLSAVLTKMGELWATGELQTDIAVSAEEFFLGFVLASLVAIAIGVLMASSKALCQFL